VADQENAVRAASAQPRDFRIDVGVGLFHAAVVSTAARPRHLRRDHHIPFALQRAGNGTHLAIGRAPLAVHDDNGDIARCRCYGRAEQEEKTCAKI